MTKDLVNKMKKFMQGDWNLTELVPGLIDSPLTKQLLSIEKNVKKFEQYKQALKPKTTKSLGLFCFATPTDN